MSERPVAYLSRRLTFKACNWLQSACLGKKANEQLYSSCRPNDEHIYIVEVMLKGPILEDTGVVMNSQDLKVLMDAAMYKNLLDAEYFKDVACTIENMCVLVWNNLKSLLPDPEMLHEVKMYSTDMETISYRGETVYT